ncbi:hypothetical protein CON73_15280 [Bacillus toyonensis]|uniref:Uncharacterized protein n=1 Tax=Bacillus toyonensis TaxID=155322 RepID=A0A2B7W2A3_9BACI|nr:hypothetical protein [Bacillus toyonensis]PGG90765.1 hypothetical protein CON73_15280 [Bacillus toyonensis]
MSANVIDIIDLFTRYANTWSEQRGGGNSRVSLILPGFEQLAFSNFTHNTKYHPPTEQMIPDAKLDSHTYTNEGTEPIHINIELSGELQKLVELKATEGVSEAGKRLLGIDLSNEQPPFLSTVPLPLGGDILSFSDMQPWGVKHPYTIEPGYKLKATLMVKQKKIHRLFEVQRTLSRYIGIYTSKPIRQHHLSLHHVSRIFKNHPIPNVEVNGRNVTATDKGTLQYQYGFEPYIHIHKQRINNPRVTEEFNIYNPQTSPPHVVYDQLL